VDRTRNVRAPRSTAGYAEIHVVVFVVANPGLLLVEGKVAHYLTPGLCRSKPRLQVDVEDDASNADAMRVGCPFERQQMQRHRFEIDRVRQELEQATLQRFTGIEVSTA